jgi:phosphate transport system substrate-binding protein
MRLRQALMFLAAATSAVVPIGCAAGDSITLQGSGATFPAPLYKRWFLEYYQRHRHVRVNYQAIGSGAGIRQFTEDLVDFGASDAAMTDAEMARIPASPESAPNRRGWGVRLLPMTAGSIVLSYNVPGVSAPLQLSRKTYVGIFLGQIESWDDAAIRKDNPDVGLPSLPITVVRRAEGSGTTFAFTNHLNDIDPRWQAENKGPGVGKSVTWPKGVGAKGNSGVAALIGQTPGAIGYLEYGYGKLSGLPMAVLENKAGAFVTATPESGAAALKGGGHLPPNFRLFISDPAGKDAYPIVTYTWMLCYRTYRDKKTADTLKEVLRFALSPEGQKIAEDIHYIPLPEEVVKQVLAAVEEIKP